MNLYTPLSGNSKTSQNVTKCHLFLSDEDFLWRDLDAHVTAGDHDGVRLGDDLVNVFHTLRRIRL